MFGLEESMSLAAEINFCVDLIYIWTGFEFGIAFRYFYLPQCSLGLSFALPDLWSGSVSQSAVRLQSRHNPVIVVDGCTNKLIKR